MKESFQIQENEISSQVPENTIDSPGSRKTPEIAVTLLTGGGDRPYAFGLATELIAKGAALDVIGSDALDFPEFRGKPFVKFLNLRGNQSSAASLPDKVSRIIKYYAKLIGYAATANPKIFHILWNNKFELFDRTLLMIFYKLLGKSIVLTVHNVNAKKRDSKDSFLNRLTLRIQYRLADRIFVHTETMKRELFEQFGVAENHVTVIPFGINNAVPNTLLTSAAARERLGLRDGDKAILFFGNIAPYKGLEFLTTAFQQTLAKSDKNYRLIIAGSPKNCETYWASIRDSLREDVQRGRVLLNATFIPDAETEIYFKAADVLVLPYRYIYQSGVLFLGYSFGLPILAADVGALKEEIVEGKTGFVFRPEDPVDLAAAIERYFASDLFANLDSRRQQIKDYATEKHSWDVVGKSTMSIYANLLQLSASREVHDRNAGKPFRDVKNPS